MADPTPPSPADALSDAVARFLADARAKAQGGGLTVAEFGALVVELLRLAVTGLDQIPSDGPAKKAWALSIVAALFDSVAGYAVPLPMQPVWLLVRPIVRQLVLAAAGGALEQILHLSRAAAAAAPTPGAA